MFDDVRRILQDRKYLADIGEPQSQTTIEEAERALGVKFPLAFHAYLATWGWISFGPNEYFGLGSDVNDVVRRTKDARDRSFLPQALVSLCDHDGDEYVCLNTAENSADDCPVVVWDNPTRSVSRLRSATFEQFLISELKGSLE